VERLFYKFIKVGAMKKFIISISSLFVILSLCSSLWAGEPTRVAIIPFNVYAPGDLSYLQDGIFDMLASRIAWEEKVVVLEKHAVKDIYQKYAGNLNEISAKKLGQELKVDYVLFGSLTVLGNSSSLDAKIVATDLNQPAMSVYTQTKSLDEVIPKVDEFAGDINAKIFGRTPVITRTAVVPPKEQTTVAAHPQRILLSSQEEEPSSNLNPDFIQLSAKQKRAGFWKSQEFPSVMRGMQITDLDGDGQKEIVFITQTDVWIYRQKGEKLDEVKHIKGKSTYDQLSVDVGDINGNGTPEIYVSNLSSGNVDSFVLEWNGSDFVRIAEHLRWYLRITKLAGGNLTIVGQQKDINSPFALAVCELLWVNKKLAAGEQLRLPVGTNVFNFTIADIDGDKTAETIMIDEHNKLKVYSASGELRWKSDEPYGETINFVTANPNCTRSDTEERIYLPSRIIVTDLNKDGIADLIVNRNLSTASRLLRNFKEYTSSEIYLLNWDGLGLAESWKTRKISGGVCDYQLVDTDGKDHYEFFVGIIMRTGIAPLVSGKSTIISYSLNVNQDK
jgi:TolB-like protein